MLEVLLLAQLSCPHLANYAVTSNGDCINLSPAFQEGYSSDLNVSEDAVTSGLDSGETDSLFEDELISARVGRKSFYSFLVYVTNNHPSRRIVPTYVTYELLDTNSIPFYTGTYSIQHEVSVIGIAPGEEAPTAVVNAENARRENRTLLRDGYSVNILSIGYDLGYNMGR